MQLTPHYGSDAVLVLDGEPGAIAGPTIRQRRRLLDRVRAFETEEWEQPSRCEGWTSRDVIAHLDITNHFWTMAIDAGRRGSPTRILTAFDPVSTPAQMVLDTREIADGDLLARFESSTTTFIELLASLDERDWTALAEAPPGHLAISAVVHHALWDAWVHERDILLPLQIDPLVEADEVSACLRYVAALGPAFDRSRGGSDGGWFQVRTSDPSTAFKVSIAAQIQVTAIGPDAPAPAEASGGLVLTGPAVDLLEALSVRAPFPQVPGDQAWMIAGLARTFDHNPGATA